MAVNEAVIFQAAGEEKLHGRIDPERGSAEFIEARPSRGIFIWQPLQETVGCKPSPAR